MSQSDDWYQRVLLLIDVRSVLVAGTLLLLLLLVLLLLLLMDEDFGIWKWPAAKL